MGEGSAVGGAGDMAARLRAALPLHWFADDAPVLGAVLGGLGATWAQLYDMLQWVGGQSRIGTADGDMLDMIASDFFGSRLVRRPGQGDERFRAAILRELLRERATRAGLAAALTDLTGTPPGIFEPTRPADTGAWGIAAGYGVAGGYGSLALPFQCFVRARRPSGQGIACVAGYEGLRADGLIDARAVSTRSTNGTFFDAIGALQTAAPGVVRIDWTSGAPLLLVEGASANQVSNPRAEGATIGPIGGSGAAPSHWGITTPVGVAASVVGTGVESGLPYVDVRWQGTVSTVGAGVRLSFEQATTIAASASQIWTASVYMRLVGGTVAGFTPQLSVLESTATGTYVTSSVVATFPTGAGLPTQRFANTRTLTGATTATVYPQFYVGTHVGDTLDFTLRVGGPQIEQAAAASSVMLPPAGSPGVCARSAESISIPATLPGGYRAGAIEYASLAMVRGQVTDADIYAAAARAMPAAAIAWTAISS